MKQSNRNSLWLAAQFSISLLLSLVNLKLNLLTFGGVTLSTLLLLQSIWGVGGSLDFGFGISTVKFVAQYKSDSSKINTIISTGFFLLVVLGLILLAIGYMFANIFYLHNRNLIPSNAEHISRMVCFASGATFYFSYLTIIFKSILEGHEDFVNTSKVSLGNAILVFGIVLSIFLFHGSIVLLTCLYAIMAIAQLFTYFILIKKLYPSLRISCSLVRIATFKEIAKFSFSVQIAYFLGALIDPLTKFIIGNYTQNRMIPPYEIARRFSLAISGLFTFTFKNALPKISMVSNPAAYPDFVYSEGIKLSRMGIAYSGIFFGILSFIFIAIFKKFYGFSESCTMFFLLALAESVNNAGYIFYVFLLGIGKSAFLVVLQLLNVVFIASFLLVSFQFCSNTTGLIGYFVSVVIGNFIMLQLIRKSAKVDIIVVYRKIGLMKLFLLELLLLCDTFVLSMFGNYWLIAQATLSFACFLIFYKEVRFMIASGMRFIQTLLSRAMVVQ